MSAFIRSLVFCSFILGSIDYGEAAGFLVRCKSRTPTLTLTSKQVSFDAGKSSTVDIRVDNKDTRCSDITFTVTASHSSSLTSKLSSSSMSIKSESSQTTRLTLSSSTAGSYPVKVSVAYKGGTLSDTVNVTVRPVATTTPTPTPKPPTPTPTPAPSELTVYTDGTARLNQMLDASLNVTIPAGIYIITESLKVRNNHVISAAANAQVILKAADTYKGQLIYLYYTKATIRGLTFDGNYSKRLQLERDDYASLIMISNSNNVILENNKFQYGPSYGVWSANSPLIQIRGNTFFEVYQPIRIDGGNQESGVINKNTFTNTKAYKSFQHIDAIWTKNLIISENTFEGAGLGEPSYKGILGTWGNSIYIHHSTGHIVEKNKVYKNYWAALVSGTQATHGIIRNNYFMGWGSAVAVWMEQPGAEYLTFENNEVDGGISIGDNGANHFIIRNNIIRSNITGIDATFGAKDVLIEGNQFISTDTKRSNMGVYLFEKNTPDVNVRVHNNSFKGFGTGISINNYQGQGSVYGINLKGNTFENNKTNIWINPGLKLMAPLGQ